jgi:hypothetical protein
MAAEFLVAGLGFLVHCRSGCHRRNTESSYETNKNKKTTVRLKEL